MIIIDIFVILIVLALLVGGGPYIYRKYLRSDPKRKELEAAEKLDEQGEVNTVKFTLDQLRYCMVCRKATDPKKDLRVSASWIHPDCYMHRELNKDKNNA